MCASAHKSHNMDLTLNLKAYCLKFLSILIPLSLRKKFIQFQKTTKNRKFSYCNPSTLTKYFKLFHFLVSKKSYPFSEIN
jgi:hypothetical protein